LSRPSGSSIASSMKICSIVGARPQFVKLAPLERRFKNRCQHLVVHTGQHYDYEMSQLFFKGLHLLEPDYNLAVGSCSHGHQTGEMLKKCEEVLVFESPDLVLVYGDTNSTLAGALATSKLNLTLGHIEAGMRSYRKDTPEEINRLLTDHLSDLLFCPTETSVANLHREGIEKGVHLVGDVMLEILEETIKLARSRSGILEELGLEPNSYLLLTVHRAENTDNAQNLASIVKAVSQLSQKVVFPMHPRVEKMLKQFDLHENLSRETHLILTPPLSYLDMLELIENAGAVLTDSGGLQKEACYLQTSCITLRTETEWVETVESGANVLVGTEVDGILEAVEKAHSSGNREWMRSNLDSPPSAKIWEIIDQNIA
jgi:UDP-N-acetylglucosamine 2-epimerase